MRTFSIEGFAVAVAIGATATGCYTGGFATTTHAFVGEQTSSGCVDLALAAATDAVAPGPIVAYTFGNRCYHQTVVDFAAIRAIGVSPDGSQVALAAADPRHELVPMRLDALAAAEESIAYRVPVGDHVTKLCLDVAGVDTHAVHRPPATWVCIVATTGARGW